uniref:Uncharacterized protein n=1 Tax=Avena sativa TaxID=4498 RepID=A0ACD5UAM7_AVESA
MAVYYRYRSGVDTFSLPVSAPSISVGELKRLIMGTSRHGHGRTRGRGPREGIAISDAQTGMEYADESAPVLRNSTVVVRRIAGPPAGTIVASSSPQRPKASQDRGDASSSSDSLSSSGLSASEEDEAKAISAVIEAVSEPARSGHHGRAPHAGYVCRRCRVPGHFIQHCPTNGDPRFNFGPPAPAAPAADSDDDDNDGVPADLHCKICKKVMADAVMSSKCCFSSFCHQCIRAHIVASSRCACGAPARADDLVPNPALRTTISNILAARATNASKQRSSDVGSDVAATSAPQIQSPAASSESRRSHVPSKKSAATESEHGDVSGSMSAPRAVREPRKEQETTGTAEARPNHADHHRFGYSGPFAPACYFGGNGMPWSADPSMYCYGYGGTMPHAYGGGYPMGPHHVDAMGNMTVPPPGHGGESYGYRGKKRTGADCEDRSFKRRCGGGRSQVALVLT